MNKQINRNTAVFLIWCILLSTGISGGKADAQTENISQNVRVTVSGETRNSKSSKSDADDTKTRRIEGQFNVAGAKNAQDAAERFVKDNSAQLGISPIFTSKSGERGLRLIDQKASLTGTHFSYRQFYGDLPVFNEQLKVSVNRALQVTQVSSDIVPVPSSKGIGATPKNKDEAVKAAVAAVNGKESETPQAEAGILLDGEGKATTVFRVNFMTKNPGADWEVFVDAETNKVLSVRNTARYATGKAMVFRPNPIISSGLTNFVDNDDADSPELNKQRVSVILNDLDTSGNLSGIFATTSATRTFTRAKSASRNFNFLRSDDRFEEVMAYHYVTEATRYVRTLGFNVNSIFKGKPLFIDVNYDDDYNAYYSHRRRMLLFGTGGVDTGEDATVIVHEFGHALLDHQAVNFDPGALTEGGAIHEGFGDYMSATFFHGTGFKKGAWNVYLGSWFAVGIPDLAEGKPPFLRTVTGAKKYPTDLDSINEPHSNGEIWSATLWDIFKKLGKPAADKLILESNFRLTGKQGFTDAALNILQVDRELNAGRNQKFLRQIFVQRGMLDNAPVNLAGGIWKGVDKDPRTEIEVLQYEYEFRADGTAKVTVKLPGGTDLVDESARYTISGSRISISIGEGKIQQDGSINGDKLAGQSIVIINDTGNPRNSRFSDGFNRAMSKSKSAGIRGFFMWGAAKSQ